MATRASLNGTRAAEMEFEAAHYSYPEMEDESAHPYSGQEGYNNPYSHSEFEEEWETYEGSHYSDPYSHPEQEEEWEMHEGSHHNNPYSHPEFEEEWETPE